MKTRIEELNPREAELVQAATEARERAYAPYSHFKVGAALRTVLGHIYTGVNVENASYGLTNCAERTAIFTAVSGGEREFIALAVVTENASSPCGACRQVMAEFAPELTVLIADTRGNVERYSMDELLPRSFTPDQL